MPVPPALKKKSVAKDDMVLDAARPKGAHTGGNQQRRRRQSCGATGNTVHEYDPVKHQQTVSLAKAYSPDGTVKTKAEDWQPEPLSNGSYGSAQMKALCDDFAQLVAEIAQNFTGGK